MAINEENNLIGYDPLAWMEGEIDKSEDHLVDEEIAGENKLVGQQLIDKETNIINDYPEDPTDDIEKSVVVSTLNDDEGNITNDDESKDQSDTIMAAEMIDDSVNVGYEDGAMQGIVTDESETEEIARSQIDLDSTLTIQNVVKLHEKLKLSLAMHDQIEINASDVASIDTSTLQLLVSLKKDAVKLQKQVSIIYPSPRFIESANLLGLCDVLDVHGA
jgi:anti-anti-sigma regulatory factor